MDKNRFQVNLTESSSNYEKNRYSSLSVVNNLPQTNVEIEED